jgi:hypothetical protein
VTIIRSFASSWSTRSSSCACVAASPWIIFTPGRAAGSSSFSSFVFGCSAAASRPTAFASSAWIGFFLAAMIPLRLA